MEKIKCTLCNKYELTTNIVCDVCEDKIVELYNNDGNKKAIGLDSNQLVQVAEFIVSLQKESKIIPEEAKSKVDWNMLENEWYDFFQEKFL